MHISKLTIGEFLPKRLGLKKNVINAPKSNVIKNAMLSKTKSPNYQLEIPEQFKDIKPITNGFAPNNFHISNDLFETKYKVDTDLLLKTPLFTKDTYK
ncbi:MAG: hypothetical protein KIC80_08655 [Brachyspira sp.]|jgi:hypothetical protein|nr:hypothetical protein [Brachyspira sp.]